MGVWDRLRSWVAKYAQGNPEWRRPWEAFGGSKPSVQISAWRTRGGSRGDSGLFADKQKRNGPPDLYPHVNRNKVWTGVNFLDSHEATPQQLDASICAMAPGTCEAIAGRDFLTTGNRDNTPCGRAPIGRWFVVRSV